VDGRGRNGGGWIGRGVEAKERRFRGMKCARHRPTEPRILKVPSSGGVRRTAEGGHPSKINREGAVARNLN